MTRVVLAGGALVAAMVVLPPAYAAAQDTREAAIAEAQAEKAAQLAPYVPSKAERMALAFKRQLLETPDGFYPWFESVYGGGGFTLGGGYRRFYGDRTFWDLRGLLSAKSYKLIEAATESVGLGRSRVDVRAVTGWRDATQVAFYGVGQGTTADDKSNFGLEQFYVGGLAHGRGPGLAVFDVAMLYEDFSLKAGAGSTPSIEQSFNAGTAPGLGDDPTYYHMKLGGGIDSRPSPGYARRGGLYALTYDTYIDHGGTYSFDTVQAEVVQHVPILRENWVLSFHGAAKTVIDNDDTVPYFLLPSLGSGSTLRGYPSWRFRDRHSLLVSGEWRWIPSRMALDVAIFYDAGKVADRREELNFSGLKTDVGAGIRFHGPAATPLRVDVARGSEGINIVFSGGAAF